jgi:3-hydroxybutyryl-CoA dehydrogenase
MNPSTGVESERAVVVAVLGAGTMGAGIAQVAAVAGHPVLIYDLEPGAAERAVASVRLRIEHLHAKGRTECDIQALSLTAALSMDDLAPAGVVIEAVSEDLAVKRGVFADLEKVVAPDCVLATNTSSLSPTAIATGLRNPGRVVGMHFFNPAALMRLVEIIPGLATEPGVVERVSVLARAWGKTVVVAAPTPGFIVNRLARPFYAEAWRLHEENVASPEVIDAVLTRGSGFRMGPFALMDAIGQDVNEAVTRSVWSAFGYDPRFAPSLAQRALVEAGRLGRKTGRGCYDYTDGAQPPTAAPVAACPPPLEVVEHGNSGLSRFLHRTNVPVLEGELDGDFVELPSTAMLLRCRGVTATELAAGAGRPVIVVDRAVDDTVTAAAIAVSRGCPSAAVDEATGLLQAAGLDVFVIDDVPGMIITRTVAMLVNFAVDALQHGVATAADIDTAMRLGTNYPIGPLEWGERWGPQLVLEVLDALARAEGDPRYRASTLLRRQALAGGPLASLKP